MHVHSLTDPSFDEVEDVFRRALSGFDLSVEDRANMGFIRMLETFDGPFRDIAFAARFPHGVGTVL